MILTHVFSTDVPSEAYWKKLAQSKSKALEVNRILSEKLRELEESMKIKDEMLDEARAMADVLKVIDIYIDTF